MGDLLHDAATNFIGELTGDLPVLLVRTVVTFIFILATVRWTGKRSVANLAPYDLALVILMGELAAIPVADLRVELMHGLFPLVLIGGLHVLMTTINMHYSAFEEWTEGRPTLLVKDGEVLKANLRKERVSMIDLHSALRQRQISDVSEVREAWMEPAGGISVFHKRRPATDSDLEAAIEQIVQANCDRIRAEIEALLRERGQPGR